MPAAELYYDSHAPMCDFFDASFFHTFGALCHRWRTCCIMGSLTFVALWDR